MHYRPCPKDGASNGTLTGGRWQLFREKVRDLLKIFRFIKR
jgi:hypothetical protein